MTASATATVQRTICNRDCPDSCGILATVENGRVVKLRGDPDHPFTRGFLCYRTNQFLRRQHDPARLQTPWLRKQGTLQPVGWEEALDHVASALLTIREQSGPEAIFHYRSGGSLGMLKGLTDRFFEHFGPVTVKSGDICSGAGEAAQALDFGVSDSSDPTTLLQSKHIILWGKNVHVSSPHTIPLLKQAQAQGTELTLIDPVHHEGVRLAQHYIRPAPGGDLSLALGIGRRLFEQDWIDPAATSYCDNVEGYRQLCFSASAEQWAQRADVSVHVLTTLARRFAKDTPCALLIGWGLARRSGGGSTVRALDALASISGNVGIAGGGASYYVQRRAAFDSSVVGARLKPPRTIDETHFGQAIQQCQKPGIRALWVTAGNPVAMLPDSQANEAAIRALELSVVVDSFLTDTARCATVVFPTTTLLEDDDILGSYGTPYVGMTRPVVPPPAGVRSDLEIIQALAQRVGLFTPMAGTAEQWKARALNQRAQDAGLTLQAMEAGAVRNPLAPKVVFEGRKFATSSGKVCLLTEATHEPPLVCPQYPLKLMALSTRHSQSAQWALAAPNPLPLTVHPDAAPGIEHGATAELQSRIGSLSVIVCHDRNQRTDVALLPKGGHHHLRASANSLLQPRSTDLGAGGALYEQPVRLVASPPLSSQ